MSAPEADDDDPESLTGEGVTVVRGHGCFRRLTWEIHLGEPPRSWPSFRDALVGGGFVDHTRLPSVWDFEAPGGHRLIVLPETGRLQLRLHYLSEPDGRPELALSMASGLARLVPRE